MREVLAVEGRVTLKLLEPELRLLVDGREALRLLVEGREALRLLVEGREAEERLEELRLGLPAVLRELLPLEDRALLSPEERRWAEASSTR